MTVPIQNEKKWVLEIRAKILMELFDAGYTDADIARIMMSTDRANITRHRHKLTGKRVEA